MTETKKKLSDKDKQIEKLQQRIAQLEQELLQLKEQHKAELARYRNGYMAEIDKAIKRAEVAERKNIAPDIPTLPTCLKRISSSPKRSLG